MKLLDLLNEEDEQVPSNIPSEETKRLETISNINRTINKWNVSWEFNPPIKGPDGDLRVTVLFKPNSNTEVNDIEIGITFNQTLDKTPYFPKDILFKSIEHFIVGLKRTNPDIMDETLYPIELLNEYPVTIYNVSLYPGESIIRLSNHISRALYNTKCGSPQKLGVLLYNKSYLINHYMFNENDLPVFSDDYSLAMLKVIRRVKTVYTALQKGTWRGKQYQLPPYNQANILPHQDTSSFSLEDRVIRPEFRITYTGYTGIDTILDGEPLRDVLPAQVQDDFKEYIIKRFEQFDITFNI